ncbi:GNAT family N-acetyltransferase [Jannaschia sp. W003]|uniref:GNAT family N-acetyltransferase n=1 Tax=Jannaschia sp. W003 TaxID=2867012 RepID=UPI0021A53122|nr:GNAT family N-acetyltransferase [Jannaschia sp. W003]UWQ21608.1 GNAT family N-acetyltransferase [Jannaschia sp. W003]
MSVAVRRAAPFDAGAMAALLNAIIAEGGTTALTEPVTGDALRARMRDPEAAWHVAEVAGDVAGFQWIAPHAADPEACEIATFVARGRHGLGIGSALWEATRAEARARGWRVVEAVIRADNDGGCAYYRSRGFEAVGWREGVRLSDGRQVDKVVKRFRL